MKRTLIALMLISTYASAEVRECSIEEQRWLDKELPLLTSWPRIHASFLRNVPECDDGFFAEGYTEAVVKMLAVRWQSLPELRAFKKNDPKFFAFVLKHIDASADGNDLKQIRANAKQRCAPENRDLCSLIEQAAERAIQEL